MYVEAWLVGRADHGVHGARRPTTTSPPVNQSCPVDRVGNQAKETRLAEVIVHAQRRAKDAAAFVSLGPGHRLHTVPGGEQYGRVGRETGPAIDLALGNHRFHALDHRMVPGTLRSLDFQQTASPRRPVAARRALLRRSPTSRGFPRASPAARPAIRRRGSEARSA